MAYGGFLISVGGYNIPLKFMRAETYKVTMNTMDLDSYRDVDGVLHRTSLEHVAPKVEFNTPFMKGKEVEDLMSKLRGAFNNEHERKCSCQVFIPELNDYKTCDMYMPDPTFTIYGIDEGEIIYNETTLKFIGN